MDVHRTTHALHSPDARSRVERLERLTERRFIAEPKLDGQRRRRISPSAAPWSAVQSILEV